MFSLVCSFPCLGVRFDDGDVLLFGTVLEMRTVKHKHTVETILNKAIDENDIERTLKEINEVRKRDFAFDSFFRTFLSSGCFDSMTEIY